ncbi:MAG TPA: LytTR family DNA-binding domain-containing protein [Labilithrix sp.]|jgi:two-component system LytT family response regulator
MKALLVDDEPPARERLKRLLRDHADVVVAGEAGDGAAALAEIATLAPDVVFLDVQMPELDGLRVAEALDEGPAVIFATAYEEHAVRAFELAAVDYLLKPITKERLATALDRVRARATPAAATLARAVLDKLDDKPRKMAVKCGARFHVFDVRRVEAVLAQDHYAAIHVDGKELLSEEPLDRIMTRLDPTLFLRVHRSGIVNVDCVKELEAEGERKYVAVLTSGVRVPIARDRLDEVKSRLGA